MDVEHENLLNSCKYAEAKSLKKLYRAFGSLERLAIMGNRAAVVVYLDLKHALAQSNLTALQKRNIQLHLIDGHTLMDIAVEKVGVKKEQLLDEYGKYVMSDILVSVNAGLNKIAKILHSGELYGNGRCGDLSKEQRSELQIEEPVRGDGEALYDGAAAYCTRTHGNSTE
jgi:hypothetical protein